MNQKGATQEIRGGDVAHNEYRHIYHAGISYLRFLLFQFLVAVMICKAYGADGNSWELYVSLQVMSQCTTSHVFAHKEPTCQTILC